MRHQQVIQTSFVLLALAGLMGCSGASTSGSSGSTNLSAQSTLSLSPSTNTPAEGSIVTLTVYGGTAPYTLTKVTGSGTLSGNYYYAPNSSETAEIQVTDATSATAEAVLTVGSQSGVGTGNGTGSTTGVETYQMTFATLQEYQPQCNSGGSLSAVCASAYKRACVALGFTTGFGPVE